jgi:beta-glucosidase
VTTTPEALARRFSPEFLWGVAAAAYQIEGAWDADGKGESIWDVFCRTPGAIANNETGATACDHYRRWREDVALMAELGVSAYRLSVAWSRVLPDGTGRVEKRGLAFYDRLVDGLLEAGIRPFVTLYHWDLPQALQERGGWGESETAERFGEYAGLVASRLGDRVHDWITLNEPEVVAFAGHLRGVHAPGLRDPALALRAAHHLLLAHAAGVETIRSHVPDAEVGVALNLSPCEPVESADAEAARRLDGYLNRWFLDPLFGRGYPPDMLAWYGDLAPTEAPASPPLDFLGMNYYSRRLVREADDPLLRATGVLPRDASVTAMGWEVYPAGLRDLLLRLEQDYGPRRIYVTENGAAFTDEPDEEGNVDDRERVAYLAGHVNAVGDAIRSGVPVDGYFVWSLLDNFEWQHGYAMRFGLVRVDYETQRRSVKESGRWYARLIAGSRAKGLADAHA